MARVCMIAYTHYSTDSRVRREAEALATRGDRVDVICLGGALPASEAKGVRVYEPWKLRYRGERRIAYVAQYGGFFLLAALLAGWLHLRRRYHVVQVHTMPDFMVFAAAVPKLLGAKVLLDVHDLTPELYASKFEAPSDSKLVRLLTWVERRSIAFADRAIAVHAPHLDALVEHGSPREKFTVVMNVADPEVVRPPKGSPPPHDTFRLVYHGTVARRHGLEFALRAIAHARDSVSGLELTVAGDGDDVDRLLALVSELGLDDAVTFRRGFVPFAELAPTLAAADVGVVPIYDDSFTRYMLPVKLMEYVALGIPAICTSTRTIRAYFDDSMVRFVEAGNVDDLAAAIVELHADPQKRRDLVDAASAFNREFGWPAESARYRALIDSLAG